MKSSKTLGNRAFMFAVPNLWNNLLHDIRTTTSLSCVKINAPINVMPVGGGGGGAGDGVGILIF